MPLVSIIVPVYNVEKYIRKCVGSLIDQKLKDIEIILVDDGSTDKSGAICDEYASKDSRIVVIHKKNGGLSDARNAGIDIASGEYIGFVDGDDFVSESMYSTLYSLAKNTNSEISICCFENIDSDDAEKFYFSISDDSDILTFNKRDALLEMFKGRLFFVSAWNKLYKRELFNGIRYPFGKIHEDMFTTYKLMDIATSVVYTSQKLYAYVARNNSITRCRFHSKRFDNLEALDQILDYFREADDELLCVIYDLCYDKSLYLLNLICEQRLSLKSFRYYRIYRRYVIDHEKILRLASANNRLKMLHIDQVIASDNMYFLKYKYKEQLERIRPKRIISKVKRLICYKGK